MTLAASSPWAIDALAHFASDASSAAFQQRIAVHAADGVIALLAGRSTREGRVLAQFFTRTDSGPLATLSANAAAMRLSEIDDIHRPSAITASAIALPSALAMAAFAPAQPQRFADALFVGQTLSVRLGLAMGGARLMAQGLWPSYLVAPFGAAATAARVLGLPPDRMRHALAIALAQTPRSVGRSAGPRPGRWLLFGNAVRSGCLAALAAADGIDGDPGLLDAAWLQAIGGAHADAALLAPSAVIQELSIKPHCAAKQTLAAVHGLQRLIAEGLDPAAIDSIEVSVPPAYAAMIDREPPSASRLASMVSVRWQLALAALQPALLDDVARDGGVADAALEAFAARVHVRADASLDAWYPATWPAHVSVSAGGQRRDLLVKESWGDPALPFGISEVRNKARRVLGAHADVCLVTQAFDAMSDPASLDQLCTYFSAPG
ncbi:MAG: MmgE/PrpD family protein [Pseudomonadota bacterium]